MRAGRYCLEALTDEGEADDFDRARWSTWRIDRQRPDAVDSRVREDCVCSTAVIET